MSADLEQFYNKFNEDKRLKSRCGSVEFITTMKYIHEYLAKYDNPKILEIGAGTGAYSVALANEGYDVTAIELTKNNLGVLKAKKSSVKAYQGNALDLKRFSDNSFDVTLLLGPMYHLADRKDQLKALSEAKRVTKENGVIFVAYIMNEFCVLKYGFMDGNIIENLKFLNDDFKINGTNNMFYNQFRLEDIESLNNEVGLNRVKIFSADGPTNYIRPQLNKLTDEAFKVFLDYHLSTCERSDLMGACEHTVDILNKFVL